MEDRGGEDDVEEYVCNNLGDFGSVCAEGEDGLVREKISVLDVSLSNEKPTNSK